MTPYYEDDFATIYHGDCREILTGMPRRSTDLLLTDPPYGISYRSNRGNQQHGNAPLVGDDGSLDVASTLRLALEVVKCSRHFYVFGPLDCSSLTVGATAELVWDKGPGKGMGDLSLPWRRSHERITFGTWSPRPSHDGIGRLSARLRRGSVILVPPENSGQGAKHHPTAKPVLLLRQLIEASTVIGDTVLDPFMGAGSTLLAARIEGRKAIGIEIEERYCETAAERLSQEVLDFGGAA